MNLFLSVFWSLSTVFRTCLPSLGNTCCVKRTSNDMISCTWKVFYSSSTDKNNAMLLKVVSLSWNVACYFDTVRQTYSGDLSKS